MGKVPGCLHDPPSILSCRHSVLSDSLKKKMPIALLKPIADGVVAIHENHAAFRNLGLISVAVLLLPFIIWGIWNTVKGWGKWRVQQAGDRPHYVRTWHGWVEAEKEAARARGRAKLRNHIRQKLVWKTTTADYSWIFWDPSGAKRQEYEENRRHSIIRHLPRWTRSDKPGSLSPDARIAPNRLGAAEEGKVSWRSFRHSSEIQPLEFSFTGNQSWLRSSSKKGADAWTENHTRSDSLPMMTGALADSRNALSLSNVRRGRHSMGQFQVWDADIQDQFLVPEQTGNLGADIDSARQSGASALHVQPSLAGFARRASSLPLFATLRVAYNARRRLKDFLETLSPIRSLRKARPFPAGDHSAPENPDDLQGSGHMTTRLRNPEGNLQASIPPESMQIFNQMFEPLANPVVLNPFMSIGTEYSGTAGRPGSPIMDWTAKRERAGISEYEADGASSFLSRTYSSASFRSRSNGEYPDMHLSEASLQKMKDSMTTSKLDTYGRMGNHHARGVHVSDSFFQGNYSPGSIGLHFSLLPRNTSGKNLTSKSTPVVPPRSRTVSSEASFAEHLSFTESLSMLLHADPFHPPQRTNPKSATRVPFDLPRSSTQMRSPTKSSTRSTTNAKTIKKGSNSGTSGLSQAKRAMIERTGCLSPLERAFLDDIDLRLSRLDYELSPGFRGPLADVTSPIWWFEPVPYAASVACRDTQSFINHIKVRTRPLNPPPILRRSHTTLDIPEIIDTNVPSTVLRRRASSQDFILPRRTSTFNGEPEEGAIDTAAWILRRPPMGALHEDSAENSLLFTSGRGTPKTLLEWQRSEPSLPLQQAFDRAAAISRRPVKHLKRFGILCGDRNNSCKDEKQPLRAACQEYEDVGDGNESAVARPPL